MISYQLTPEQLKSLGAYVADYINEEIQRGTEYIDRFMIDEAIRAFMGGAANE